MLLCLGKNLVWFLCGLNVVSVWCCGMWWFGLNLRWVCVRLWLMVCVFLWVRECGFINVCCVLVKLMLSDWLDLLYGWVWGRSWFFSFVWLYLMWDMVVVIWVRRIKSCEWMKRFLFLMWCVGWRSCLYSKVIKLFLCVRVICLLILVIDWLWWCGWVWIFLLVCILMWWLMMWSGFLVWRCIWWCCNISVLLVWMSVVLWMGLWIWEMWMIIGMCCLVIICNGWCWKIWKFWIVGWNVVGLWCFGWWCVWWCWWKWVFCLIWWRWRKFLCLFIGRKL